MRKICIVILYLSFVTFIVFPQDDEPKPVVAVLMLENKEKDSRLDVLCCTIKDTIALTLKLMGIYRVIEDDKVMSYEKTDKIKQYAIDNKVDNVMFGRTLKNDKGQHVYDYRRNYSPYFTLHAYDDNNSHEKAPVLSYDNFKIWYLSGLKIE